MSSSRPENHDGDGDSEEPVSTVRTESGETQIDPDSAGDAAEDAHEHSEDLEDSVSDEPPDEPSRSAPSGPDAQRG